MEKKQKLATFRSLHVEVKRKADKELLTHLYSTVLGTPGGMQYMHSSIEPKLENISEMYFMLLKKSDRLLGSVGFARRVTEYKDKDYRSWYIRYFSIKAPLQSRKHDQKKIRQDAGRGIGLLKGVAYPYFENPDMLEDAQSTVPTKSFIYAYIERANFRSLNFSEQMGLRTVRQFTTVVFSRIMLRKNENVSPAEESEREAILGNLKEFYRDYTMYTDVNIFPDKGYFVFKENGRMVAGIQAHPDAWKLVGMKSSSSWLMLRLLPSIPGIKKIYNPKHLRFLALEGLWYLPGYEDRLGKLLEGVCAHYRIHLAMIWLDTRSRVLRDIDEHVSLGFLDKFMSRVTADIRMRFLSMEDEEVKLFSSKPAYISGLDMT